MKLEFPADELELLTAIHSDPRSDAPRLAYADWLASHGEPEYAEFIRLQCQTPYVPIATLWGGELTHRLFGHGHPREDDEAWRRFEQLKSLFPVVFSAPRFAPFRECLTDCEFYRGLVFCEVDDRGNVSLSVSRRLWELRAQLMHVRFCYHLNVPKGQLPDHLADPIMRLVDQLHVAIEWNSEGLPGKIGVNDIQALARLPHLERLERLVLSDCLSDAAIPIAEAELYPKVTIAFE